MTSPYLPNIIKSVVQKVNDVLAFDVFFDYGLYVDVSKNLYKKANDGVVSYPLIWLVDTWKIDRGNSGGYHGEVSFQLIIAMPTQKDYTSEERTQNIFVPRLYPIYEELLNQVYKASEFTVQAKSKIVHTVEKRSYWGGVEGGSDAPNLFKDYIDALHIPSMTLILK